MITWTNELEKVVLDMKRNGKSYRQIAEELSSTPSSVKHKIRRLRQSQNIDKYKHTHTKINFAENHIPKSISLKVLETHAGFGNMTQYWLSIGDVTSIEINQDRCNEIDKRANVIKGDCHDIVFDLISRKEKYDVIDIDPYGLPSRLFPHIFRLIDNGVVFLTFPKYGSSQLNKISVAHYKILWGIENNDHLIEKVQNKLNEYGFHQKKELFVLDYIDLGKVIRFAISVKKVSLLDVVGLVINRK